MLKTLNDIIEDATLDYEIKDAPVAGAPGERTEYHVVDADWLIETCRAALAKPPRNCDVGTVEEQSKRFRDFCKIESSASGGHCTGCRAICYGKNKCELAWAQMPYESKGENK